MKITVTSESHIDVSKLVGMVDNDAFWIFATEQWHDLIRPYVPMDTGIMEKRVIITPKQIEYTAPYAHYQYMGEVYGPNIPITQGGVVVGFFSKPGVVKHPTGASLNYKRDKNPLASARWDKAAEPSQKAALIAALQAYVDRGG